MTIPTAPITINESSTSVRVMLRHEVKLPCIQCDAKVMPGEFYKVTSWVGDEVTSIIHHSCDRRKIDR